MTAKGTLLAESIRLGASLEGVRLVVHRIRRVEAGDEDLGQPRIWTFIEFELDDDEVEVLVAALSGALEAKLGWYCDFRSDQETFVAFSGRVFRYSRGDRKARSEAENYARSVGVPTSQLDWPE